LDSRKAADKDVNEALVNYFLFTFFALVGYSFALAYIYPIIEEFSSLIFSDALGSLALYFKDMRNINKLIFTNSDLISFIQQYNSETFSKIDLYVYLFYNY
jgi:hypothetical protein